MGRTLTANIRERRGSLVDIKVPIYVDKDTVLPEGTSAPQSNGHIGEYLRLSMFGAEISFREAWTHDPIHQDGRHGFRYGMLLSPNHIPGMERR